jgi:hypothetical protein
MKLQRTEIVQQNGLALSSCVCLIAGWLLIWILIESGANSRFDSQWAEVGAFGGIAASPVAAALAIAGLVFDHRKLAAMVALLLSLISTVLVISMGA